MNEEQDQKMENILGAPMHPFDSITNCTYITNGGKPVKLSINALFKIMEDISKPPLIITMPIQLVASTVLQDNTIWLGKDVAEALEEALKG